MSVWMRGASDEGGAGTVLTLGIAAACLALAMLVIGAAGASIAQARAAAAADAAALAAADALSGYADGEPCALAATVAESAGASVTTCDAQGFDVRIIASIPFGPFEATARARAGPPRASASAAAALNFPEYRLSGAGTGYLGKFEATRQRGVARLRV